MIETTLGFLLTTLVVLIVAYAFKVWYSYQHFKKLGIPTPPFRLFFGNFLDIRKNKNFSEVIRDWTKQYGKVYGYYEGHLPVLVVSDINMVQEILVKQYSNFSARKKGSLDRGEKDHRVSLFTAVKTQWRKMRNIMNPTFSSAKIRGLNSLLLKTCNRLTDLIDRNSNGEVNVTNYFKCFTMDTIWSCAFGLDIDLQNNPNNPYLEKSERLFRNAADFTIPMYLGTLFSEFKRQLIQLMYVYIFISTKLLKRDPSQTFPFAWLNEKVTEIVKHQQNQKEKGNNYVQLLLDAQSDDIEQYDDATVKIDHTQTRIAKKLTTEEIQRNLVLFMLAGYETSSTALGYIFYVLATNKEEQAKVRMEIDEKFPLDIENPDEAINTDSVQTLEYLDMFIKEVLRFYSLASGVVTRRCMYPTTVNGIEIEKDQSIMIDVLSIHLDPDLWGPVDPNLFYPPRFSAEHKRHPMAFLAFGQGPRLCIGMKFAIVEIKMAIIKLLRQFEVHPCEKTRKKLELVEGIVRSPKEPIYVEFKRR